MIMGTILQINKTWSIDQNVESPKWRTILNTMPKEEECKEK